MNRGGLRATSRSGVYRPGEELAEGVCQESPVLQPLPMLLFEHSMGTIVAFEVASCLGESPPPVIGLVASARPIPSHRSSTQYHLGDYRELFAELKRLEAHHVSALDDETLARIMLPTIRCDYQAIEGYHHPDVGRVDYLIVVLVST